MAKAHQGRSDQKGLEIAILLSQRAWSYYKRMLILALHGGKASESPTLEAVCLTRWEDSEVPREASNKILTSPIEPHSMIHYIHKGSSSDMYQSK
ncbi:hypothetical protein CK203_060696 [Vitis vinifera]|uniref:Uncharacterized protein n=1 Tax=Vitis vinifera TaxID=29760 RepID=A0A438GCD8_VITVI|nr:hypothetical protein CK203_060696 [Vitis vinifera]